MYWGEEGVHKSSLGSSSEEQHEHTDMGDSVLKNHSLFSVISINISTSLAYVRNPARTNTWLFIHSWTISLLSGDFLPFFDTQLINWVPFPGSAYYVAL